VRFTYSFLIGEKKKKEGKGRGKGEEGRKGKARNQIKLTT